MCVYVVVVAAACFSRPCKSCEVEPRDAAAAGCAPAACVGLPTSRLGPLEQGSRAKLYAAAAPRRRPATPRMLAETLRRLNFALRPPY